MENQKDANYGQDSRIAEKQPWTPEYQKSSLKENSNDNQNPETEDLANESDFSPITNRNIIDSNSASDTQNDEYIKNEDEEDYVDKPDDEDNDMDEEDFEGDGDFEEKDIDYREKKERDSF